MVAQRTDLPAAPRLPTRRWRILVSILLAGVVAFFGLDLKLGHLIPTGGGLSLVGDFFSAAFMPAFTYESSASLPAGTQPFLFKVGAGLWTTLVYAVAAISLSLVIGMTLGVLASVSFWERRHRAWGTLRWTLRIFIAAMRSVHELLLAVVFLATLGINPAAAVLAITIPFSGTLAKVFSEMLDESPRAAADALTNLGATPLQVFFFGRLPRALPDIAAYGFYRFECAVRSSAVLGFFGFTTIGLYLRQSFENLHYREVWTYLYALILVVLLLEVWSSQLRRRFVA
jgi:phosphonate transport system permease protein